MLLLLWWDEGELVGSHSVFVGRRPESQSLMRSSWNVSSERRRAAWLWCLQGYFVQPTVIVNAPDDSRLMQEEIFGPVVCVVPFDSESEVSSRLSVFIASHRRSVYVFYSSVSAALWSFPAHLLTPLLRCIRRTVRIFSTLIHESITYGERRRQRMS